MVRQAAPPSSAADLRQVIAENRIWFMILGICLIVLGILAILFPLMSTIAAKSFLGWLFLIGGVVQASHAFSTQKWSAFFLDLLLGILYVIVGAWLAFFPLAGIITLTILLSAMFIAQGVLELMMAFMLRSHGAWVWVLISGLLALLIGVMIFVHLPSSAAWAIGLLAGINLLSSGWAYFFLALVTAKNA